MGIRDAGGLVLQETGQGSDRSMQTIRLDGNHIASISYAVQTDRQGIEKRGFWVQLVDFPNLTAEQRACIDQHLTVQVALCLEKTLGGQK